MSENPFSSGRVPVPASQVHIESVGVNALDRRRVDVAVDITPCLEPLDVEMVVVGPNDEELCSALLLQNREWMLDKVLHFFLVGALAFFSVGWWADRSPWRVLAILSIVAIVDETGQSFSAVRSFSLFDLAANLMGILVFGYAAGRLVRRRSHAGAGRRGSVGDRP